MNCITSFILEVSKNMSKKLLFPIQVEKQPKTEWHKFNISTQDNTNSGMLGKS